MENSSFHSICCQEGQWNFSSQSAFIHPHFENSDIFQRRNTSITQTGDNGTTSCACLHGNFTRTSADDVMAPPLYLYVYATVVSSVIFAAGLFGNLLVIFVVVRMPSMRTRMNMFVVSLSVADLMVLIVCQPIALLDLYAKERWLLGAVMCKVVPFLENTAIHCSALCLLAISVERYVAICRPLKATRRNQTCLPTIPLTWALSILLCLPFIFISSLEQVPYNDGTKQWICRTKTSQGIVRTFIVVDFVVGLMAPLVAMTGFYTAIAVALASQAPGGASPLQTRSPGGQDVRRQQRRRVIKMMLTVVVFFYTCLLPFRSLVIWLVFESPHKVEQLGFSGYLNLVNTARLLMFVNSAINPVIYSLMGSRFRKAFVAVLPFLCVRHRSSDGSFSSYTAPKPSTRLHKIRSSSKKKKKFTTAYTDFGTTRSDVAQV